MIQRKQTLWLFLAALLGAGVFFVDLYTAHTMVNGVDTVYHMRTSADFLLLIVALIMTALPFVSIFMYKHRKRQVNMTLISMVATAGFVALVLWRVSDYLSKLPAPPVSSTYWVGAVLPIVSLVLLFLAVFGIRKDEKLVRSSDRLR